ncbi:hypothetical protein SCP_1303550 [Sparassis crispa]|uniref:DUF4604 domain-containing protein n=1 Tax=Sparassis crispa TaxID=139825 RepID=A0A401H2B8_9APHY|nr:hypothetical protein SCP_1303550 [Sparassis crispa]GBE88539.1 hypothetical protein SCP_1303550 [Sparassis crispa]
MPKEPTRQQLSARLAYQANTPAFLRRLQNKVQGRSEDDEDDEFEDDGSGRPPIPRRPAIPERPDDDPGSADEDDADERPQVVVLKEGKHLTEREVENEKRKAKGLPPLSEPEPKVVEASSSTSKADSKFAQSEMQSQPLSFSSSKTSAKPHKRKAVGDGRNDAPAHEKAVKSSKKKPKKVEKKLLSFGDGDV